jgi:hypothetical protein
MRVVLHLVSRPRPADPSERPGRFSHPLTSLPHRCHSDVPALVPNSGPHLSPALGPRLEFPAPTASAQARAAVARSHAGWRVRTRSLSELAWAGRTAPAPDVDSPILFTRALFGERWCVAAVAAGKANVRRPEVVLQQSACVLAPLSFCQNHRCRIDQLLWPQLEWITAPGRDHIGCPA